MQIELFQALTEANVPADKARAVVASIDQAIDDRYRVHAGTLVTQSDLRATQAAIELRIETRFLDVEKRFSDLIRWLIGSQIALLGLVVAAIKLFH